MPTAISYTRFSTPEQMQGDSFRRQTQLAQDYCTKNGLTLDASVTYNDLGVSAFRGRNAEVGKLAEFLEAVRAGLVPRGSFLLVESLDRVSRLAARQALRVLEDIVDEDITVVTLSDNKQYTREILNNEPMSLIMSILVFFRAHEESVMKSRRLKAAWVGKRQKQAQSGKALTSRGPGWLKLDKETGQWAVLKERAVVVQKVYKDYLRGFGAHTIAESLNKAGIPVFGKGKIWYRSYINKLLDESPSVIGTFIPSTVEFENGKKVYKPLDPIPGYYPAILDEETYQQVRAMREGTGAPLRGRAKKLYNIFGGLVRCSRCGGTMYLQKKGDRVGARYLVCEKARYGAGCQYTAVRYANVEDGFLSNSLRILALTPTAAEDFEAQLTELREQIADLQERKANLDEGWERTKDPAMLDRALPIREELDALKERERALSEHMEATSSALVNKRVASLKQLIANPKALDRAAVNAMVRTLFSGLSIDPDSGTATLGWKHGGRSQFTFGMPAVENKA